MVKKGLIKKQFLLAILTILILVYGCDVYKTLYVKEPEIQGGVVTVPEGNITIKISKEIEELKEQVYRVEKEQADDPKNLAKTVYAAAISIEHDPFKIKDNPLGPFEKGNSLGFTLGNWMAAEGFGTYEVDNGKAVLELEFENLVPNGIYTVWCSRIKLPPNPEITDKPCGATNGSENVFEADENGQAEFEIEMDPLEPSTEEEAAAIALAYHSDGKTYGQDPGEFGLKTHVQIFYMLPVMEEEEFELDVELVSHIEAGLPEQDVFIEIEEKISSEIMEEVEVEEEISEEAVEEEIIQIDKEATLIIVEETELVSLVPQAEDPDKDTLIFTFTSPLDENGEWQTDYGDVGQYTITVTVSDGTLATTEEVLIIVNKKEEAPVFESFMPRDTVLEIGETETVDFEVEASDRNDDVLSYTWKLDGVEVNDDNFYTYETTYEDSGSHTIKVTVSDGAFDTEKIWSVTVDNVNRDPVFEPINDLEVTENKTIEVELKASDPDDDVISFSAENLPANSTLKENIFIFSPDFDFVKGKEKEQIEITFIANDAESKDEQTVGITVFNKNRAPDLIAIIQKQ